MFERQVTFKLKANSAAELKGIATPLVEILTGVLQPGLQRMAS